MEGKCRGTEADLWQRVVYDQDDDGFMFSKSKRAKEPAVRNSSSEKTEPVASSSRPAKAKASEPAPAPVEEAAPPETAQKKTRRKFPTTPEQDAATKTIRRSKRLSNEHESSSPTRPAHTKSVRKVERSPSPEFRPVTVKKRRQKQDGAAEEEEKTTLIALPFADTPIIKRNKEMRKASADTNRRSSSGMRGKRASSLIDEGRGNGECLKLTIESVSRHVLTQFLQLSLTSKCPHPSSSNISQQTSQSPGACDVYSAGVAAEPYRPNQTRRKRSRRKRMPSSKHYKPRASSRKSCPWIWSRRVH